jgi:Arylsulfotransferase (ASST)
MRTLRSILITMTMLTLWGVSVVMQAGPSVYPTGTTVYDPARAWSGYTVFVLPDTGAVLIDMNGKPVREWRSFEGASGGPIRVLPGGHVMGAIGRKPPSQESLGVAQFDWKDAQEWKFDARQHHDWQRDDFPAGYYSPEATPKPSGGRTLILAHANVTNTAIHDQPLEDDSLQEVSWDGTVVWEWQANQHIDEMGFTPAARAAIRKAAFNKARGSVDWLHINAAAYVGPNRWYDAGDMRFHPDHVIISSRAANIIAIVGRDGKIVWRLGPDYRASESMRAIGQIIGQHHPHIIPKGLPGAGNLLVFDNGGAAGYGDGSPSAADGVNGVGRGYSRVLEIDPVSLKKIWEYSVPGTENYRFFSHYVSSAQRLPNGNTLITEGADGRLFEVTTMGAIVWEYVSPYFTTGANRSNRVYRAYRLPYSWVPQLERPVEKAVVAPDNSQFQVPSR